MQFIGKIKEVKGNLITILIDNTENVDVVQSHAKRLMNKLITVFADHEHKATFLQRTKLQGIINEMAQKMDINTDLLKIEVVEEFIRRKHGIEGMFDGTKEETSLLINALQEFCDEQNIEVKATTEDAKEIDKLISSSNRHRTCVVCGRSGETIELKEFNSKYISEWRMGYSHVTLCDKHYMDAVNTGVEFFKNHLLVKRRPE